VPPMFTMAFARPRLAELLCHDYEKGAIKKGLWLS